MREFARTSLLMLAASIGTSDPWVMTASSGAVTLVPYRMLSLDDRLPTTEPRVTLRLTHLGRVDSAEAERRGLSRSPLRDRSEVVLLLSWSLLSAVAELDLL